MWCGRIAVTERPVVAPAGTFMERSSAQRGTHSEKDKSELYRQRGKIAGTLQSLLRVLLLLLCLFLVFAYGGVQAETVAIVSLILFVMIPVVLLVSAIPADTRNIIMIALILVALLVSWAEFQASGISGLFYNDPAWQMVRNYIPSAQVPVSLTPGDTSGAVLMLAVPFGVFIATLILFSGEHQSNRLLRYIVIVGAVISVFSILQFLAQPDMVLFVKKKAYQDSLTGTFINRNTAATFFGLLLVLQVALTWQKASETDLIRSLLAYLNGIPFTNRRATIFAALSALSCLATACALMLTKSRGGIASTFAALLCLLLILVLFPDQREARATSVRKGWSWRFATATAILLVGSGIFISLAERVLFRGAAQNFESRVCVLPGIITAIKDHIPFGAGLASFREVFPAYRDARCGIYLIWDRAHNVYLEGLFSLGLPFIPLLFIGMGTLMFAYIYGLRVRRRQRYIAAVGLACLILTVLHSAVDFSLQIPGLAAFFALMCAPIVSICMLPRKRQSRVKTVKD